ncbi:hypothetical protein FHY52_05560 [Nocardia nova]|nr:hypothetical protein [Nocardia nova]
MDQPLDRSVRRQRSGRVSGAARSDQRRAARPDRHPTRGRARSGPAPERRRRRPRRHGPAQRWVPARPAPDRTDRCHRLQRRRGPARRADTRPGCGAEQRPGLSQRGARPRHSHLQPAPSKPPIASDRRGRDELPQVRARTSAQLLRRRSVQQQAE